MPFTFAHPAAALPLARMLGRFGCPSALAIGSMMPDLPYFLGLRMQRAQTHDVAALLSWSLPAGVIVYVLFHALFRQALIDLMPHAVQRRLTPAGRTGWAAVAISVLAGAATHLVWDGFTHEGTLLVRSLPVLEIALGMVAGHTVYVFHVLQFASSGLGLILLAAWSWRWYLRTPPAAIAPALPVNGRWAMCGLLAALPMAAGAWAAWGSGWDAQRAPHFVLTTLPVFFWMLTGFALARLVKRRAS